MYSNTIYTYIVHTAVLLTAQNTGEQVGGQTIIETQINHSSYE